jgi:hypothetical protein
MNDEIYSDVTIERTIEATFGLKLNISEVVVRDIPVAIAATATLFKTSPNVLYCFVQSQSNMVLADVRKMLRNMNVDVEGYIPPHGDKEYFQRIGTAKFKAMFPGKHIMSDEDTRYYQTLAPYSPALVRIARVKGDIRAFHIETKTWRKVKDYAFSKIAL